MIKNRNLFSIFSLGLSTRNYIVVYQVFYSHNYAVYIPIMKGPFDFINLEGLNVNKEYLYHNLFENGLYNVCKGT